MAAQACAAIFQPLFYGIVLTINSLIADSQVFTICMMIFMICIELAFVFWSFKAAYSLARSPFFINHILISAA